MLRLKDRGEKVRGLAVSVLVASILLSLGYFVLASGTYGSRTSWTFGIGQHLMLTAYYIPQESGKGISPTVVSKLTTYITQIGLEKTLAIYEANGERYPIAYRQPNTMTKIGLNYTRDQVFNSASVSTTVAKYLALNNNSDVPTSSWTKLSQEIDRYGLDRVTGAYLSTAGDGNCTVSYTWTCTTSAQVVYGMGIHYSATDMSDNNLLSAWKFVASRSLNIGDSLQGIVNAQVSEG